jgi:type IV secretion system protein VirB3
MIQDPLFVALTRPWMKWGVPYDGFLANAMISGFATVFIIGKPPGLLICLAVHYAMRELCRYDPHIFRKLRLFFQTKMRSRTGAVWGGSRLDPSPARIRRPADLRAAL